MKPLNETGFSLLEVLVAFFILSLALGVLYPLFGKSLRQARLAADYQQAMIIAESKLAETIQSSIETAERQGQWGQFHWYIQAQPYSVSSKWFQAYRLSIRVQWHQQYYQLNTLALYPK